MINFSRGYRRSFIKEINQFCFDNNITINYEYDMGSHVTMNVCCNVNDAEKLRKFVDDLETKRSKRSFIYKLFN